MNAKRIHEIIDSLLEEWDPLGVLQDVKIIYLENSIGEYTSYVRPIITAYLSNQSIYDLLIKLYSNLVDYPDDQMISEIKNLSDKIMSILSESEENDLRMLF